jgi:hypothetical protein
MVESCPNKAVVVGEEVVDQVVCQAEDLVDNTSSSTNKLATLVVHRHLNNKHLLNP